MSCCGDHCYQRVLLLTLSETPLGGFYGLDNIQLNARILAFLGEHRVVGRRSMMFT